MRTIIPAILIVIFLVLSGQCFINEWQSNRAREAKWRQFHAANPTLSAPPTTQPTTQPADLPAVEHDLD